MRTQDDHVLASPGDPVTTAWLVTEGSYEAYAGQRRVVVAEAGDLIGSTELGSATHALEIRCREAGELSPVSAADVDADPSLRALARKEAALLAAGASTGIDTLTRQDWFPDKNISPWSLPGPYEAREVQVTLFAFKKPSQELLPPLYEWLDPLLIEPYFVLCIADYLGGIGFEGFGDTVRYRECAIVVPVHRGLLGMPKALYAKVFLEDLNALTTGREVCGLPKVLYTPTLDDPLPRGDARLVLRKQSAADPEALLRWDRLGWGDVDEAIRRLWVRLLWPMRHHDREPIWVAPRKQRIAEIEEACSNQRAFEGLLDGLLPGLPALGWKRSIAPGAELTGSWSSEKLDADGTVELGFDGRNFRDVAFALLKKHQATSPEVPALDPLTPFGLRATFDFTMRSGQVEADYTTELSGLSDHSLEWDPT